MSNTAKWLFDGESSLRWWWWGKHLRAFFFFTNSCATVKMWRPASASAEQKGKINAKVLHLKYVYPFYIGFMDIYQNRYMEKGNEIKRFMIQRH